MMLIIQHSKKGKIVATVKICGCQSLDVKRGGVDGGRAGDFTGQ